MAKSTLVWLCPYDGRELGGKTRGGTFTRRCHTCAKEWSITGAPIDHAKAAVKTTEMR